MKIYPKILLFILIQMVISNFLYILAFQCHAENVFGYDLMNGKEKEIRDWEREWESESK